MPKLISDTNGDATVEAAILFPIMIMIFAALVMLSMFLPTRAALQNATQYAATAIATERSDSWLFYDEGSLSYSWESDKSKLKNVYVMLFSGSGDIAERCTNIVTGIEGRSISSKAGILSVDAHIVNRFIYKEVVVTAKREFDMPVKLPLISFPDKIKVIVTSTAVVQNGDEFVRSMDIAADFVDYLIEKFNLTNIKESISKFGDQATKFMGWDKE